MPPVSVLARKDTPEAAEIARIEGEVRDPAAPLKESIFVPQAVSANDEAGTLPAMHPHAGWRGVFDHLDAIEMGMVRRAYRWTRFAPVRHATIAVNLLGNGWLYPLIGVALALSGLAHAWRIVAASLLATGASHAIYAVVKRVVGRRRPFERDSFLQPLARVLDRYSFPSGHCMTLTAVLTPIVHAAPALQPAAVAALVILSWCRLAAAHHYPSDVLAGIAAGAAVAIPLARILVPV